MNENVAYTDTEDADGGVQCSQNSEKVSHVTNGGASWTAYACCNLLLLHLPLVRPSTNCGEMKPLPASPGTSQTHTHNEEALDVPYKPMRGSSIQCTDVTHHYIIKKTQGPSTLATQSS
jgi:hypothetical protein